MAECICKVAAPADFQIGQPCGIMHCIKISDFIPQGECCDAKKNLAKTQSHKENALMAYGHWYLKYVLVVCRHTTPPHCNSLSREIAGRRQWLFVCNK